LYTADFKKNLRCAHGSLTNSVLVYVRMYAVTEKSRTSTGRLFHILAPATAKFLLPRVVLAPVIARQPDSADRRCRRLGKDVTGTQ